jgi:hypothetical protein
MAVELVVVLLCGGWLASFPWGREIRAQTQHTHIHDDDEARYGKIETEKLKIAIRNFPSQRQRKMKRKEKSTEKKWVDDDKIYKPRYGKTEPKKIDKREDRDCRLVHSTAFNQELNASSHGQSPPFSLSLVSSGWVGGFGLGWLAAPPRPLTAKKIKKLFISLIFVYADKLISIKRLSTL